MDAFDRFWQWADKTPESSLTIPAELHRAVMELVPEDRRERTKLNRAAARAKCDCPWLLNGSSTSLFKAAPARRQLEGHRPDRLLRAPIPKIGS